MSGPRISDALKQAFTSMSDNIHTCMPGRIESYNKNKKSATVKPLIKKRFADGTVLSMPVITDVPVIFPSTGSTLIAFPVARGDGVLLLFAERDIDSFLSGSRAESTPEDPRRFSLTDCICIPGLFPLGNPGIIPSGNSVEIKSETHPVEIEGTTVGINGGGKKAARKTDAVFSTITDDPTFWTWLAGAAVILAGLGLVAPPPTSLTGQITGGSVTVEVGD